ncbi:TIGR03364 family FAD-dependent oxidoreductase [Blastopirellula marina]|uniref:TIGR03364 family FAD-dependent oxidoreductase n=1 Tax=Blastopirellula marina TaxID=124 RepID=A0A2S8EZB7_9BACT|nr:MULTISPECIES: TIGR03364 family FAD-dependent oxidoreductase [Pirellulaceae]PQO24974.1 TIGR03364 family FAD-dependent oxidoreductase [Blastopirellula marina]RCS40826.1 TIGR03364 family FAD-dependent oxidoreductase [Bremerella cremea]
MHYDLIVVGGGIVGLGHAWAAAKLGQTVAVFDNSPRAEGASIRNFGMVWPIGQPQGAQRALAVRSRKLWLELGAAAGFAVDPCGSLHLAHHDDEWAVLNEFAGSSAAAGLELELVTPERIAALTPAANSNGLKGGLYSHTELRVTPPTAIRLATAYLAETLNIPFHFDTPITQVDTGQVTASNGQTWTAERIVIATGAYFRHLFPEAHTAEKLRLCKLQMMLTEAQPAEWKLGPHIASGLTLRHYTSFADCPSLAAVKERFAKDSPELDRYGIHVMASQADNGGLILGDSHEYDDDVEPVDKAEIDALMLRELQKIMNIPTWNIVRRWHGLYAKHPRQMCFVREVRPEVLVVNGFGGNGMTLSLALSESVIQSWQNAPQWDAFGSS